MEWLTKKVVAGLVNRFFGQYLEDLDTQEVNNALLSGQVNLSNLKIRRDALVSSNKFMLLLMLLHLVIFWVW